MLHAAARQGTGALLPLTPACHRPAGTPTPTLPTIATECWDHKHVNRPLIAWLFSFPSPCQSSLLLSCPPPPSRLCASLVLSRL